MPHPPAPENSSSVDLGQLFPPFRRTSTIPPVSSCVRRPLFLSGERLHKWEGHSFSWRYIVHRTRYRFDLLEAGPAASFRPILPSKIFCLSSSTSSRWPGALQIVLSSTCFRSLFKWTLSSQTTSGTHSATPFPKLTIAIPPTFHLSSSTDFRTTWFYISTAIFFTTAC